MNNRELTHLWANQSRQSAKGSNLYFEGPTLYSYGPHFPLGTIKQIDGETVALFNPARYSITTSKHQSYARGAACHLTHHHLAPRLWDGIRDAATLAAALAAQGEEDAASREDEARRKRERAKERREAKRAAELALALYPAELETWRSGGRLPQLARRFPVALRLVGDTIETSQGARVPASRARRVWPFLKAAHAAELANPAPFAWQPFFSRPGFKWGDYTGLSLRRIALGSPVELIVGCHAIPFAEVELMAATLGLD